MKNSRSAVVGISLLLTTNLSAQQLPVNKWADWTSYGTATIDPTLAVVDAFHSEHKWCELGQIAIMEGVGNLSTITIKHFVVAERPCIGCKPDGEPSGHTMNATLGIRLSDWRTYIGPLVTGFLRNYANRHFWYQIGSGALIAVGSTYVGRLLKCGGK